MKLKDHYETMAMRDKIVAVPMGDEVSFNGR